MKSLKFGPLVLAILFTPLACFNKSTELKEEDLDSTSIPKFEKEMTGKINASPTPYEDLIKMAEIGRNWLTDEKFKEERDEVEFELKNDLLKSVLRTFRRAGLRSINFEIVKKYMAELPLEEQKNPKVVKLACRSAREVRQFDFCAALLKEQTPQDQAWIEAEKSEILFGKGELKESLAGFKKALAAETNEFQKALLNLRIAEVQIALEQIDEGKKNLALFYEKLENPIPLDTIFREINEALILNAEKKYAEAWTKLESLKDKIAKLKNGPFYPEVLTNYYLLLTSVLLKDNDKVKLSKEHLISSMIGDPSQNSFRLAIEVVEAHQDGKETEPVMEKLKTLENGNSAFIVQLNNVLKASSTK